ncbi:toprim domain-containing protein [Rhodobacteraceae bacterium 2376]|uniref:Toprim domain-containing protein n=1 Tax=Rhabdonatronobacter sediminivivens TaxID=2743469 RepID=A0A7Z0KZJ9_9RHOB|nr:virulence-associated E family protein [Rhabdonatronobacter sediminivivens]NYS26782.1 toprim domain-containing protein [Rhabdonatronobacter sediminivivens]
MSSSPASVSDLAARVNNRMADLAQSLLGVPNPGHSTRTQLRYGTKGSLAIEIAGPRAGRWYDHEAGIGGDGLDLIRHQKGLSDIEARRWARDWVGDMQSVPASRPVHKAKGRDQQAAVAEIVASCTAITASPAEAYLRNRGISVSPPDCIRFRASAYGHHGALVALATDAGGQVLALQQVYLTDDGRKAPLKVVKRTNKAVDGWSEKAAVRLPGNAPTILCEGIENALSIWQATGRETWACLGVSNIARAPVPSGQPVLIAADGDNPESKAQRQRDDAVRLLRKRGHEVAVADPPLGMDFNDVLRTNGVGAVRDLIDRAGPGGWSVSDWREDLLINREGEPRPVLANAILALRSAPEWRDVLWHDEFASATVARRPPPWQRVSVGWKDMPWSDRDDLLVADWLQHHGVLVPASIAGQAVEAVARDRTFHPVREYLDSLRWDGTPRIESWLSVYLGAADSPYVRAVGPRWLISAVARIHEPGAKVDCALILEGPQGIRKSTALRIMGQPWFTDRLSDLGSKDAAMETRSIWIVEIAELDTMSRAEVGTIKAFISRTSDRFRPPYGKRLVDLPRQCVFAGSVNPEGGYLKDATGGRRFWPVACGTINIPAIVRDRDQLWAEACVRFHEGYPWWLEERSLEALAAEQQSDRYQGDAWDEPVRRYVERAAAQQDSVSVAEILEKALGIERGRWTQADQNRVVRTLTSMGFRQFRARIGGHGGNAQRERRYRRDSRDQEPLR